MWLCCSCVTLQPSQRSRSVLLTAAATAVHLTPPPITPPQARVLVKSPKGPEVSPTDTFTYNSSFSNPLFRIKVNNIQLKETAEENAKTNAEVCAGVVLWLCWAVAGVWSVVLLLLFLSTPG